MLSAAVKEPVPEAPAPLRGPGPARGDGYSRRSRPYPTEMGPKPQTPRKSALHLTRLLQTWNSVPSTSGG